jgi:TonB family protein
MNRPNLFNILIVAALLCTDAPARARRVNNTSAQSPTAAVEHFSKDGISFDYPAGWSLSDKSSTQLQHLILTSAGSSALVMVIAQREPLRDYAELRAAYSAVTTPYIQDIAAKLGVKEVPPWSEAQCVPFGGRTATGFRLSGKLDGRPTTGEVYAVVMGQRLVHLVYIRADVDEAQGAPVWKSVLDTLKVERPANAPPEGERLDQIIMGGVLNGRALKKPQPDYPPIARAARAQGTVVVQIVVDENGDVISATALSGHPLLQQEAVRAAREAKFTPTKLCGKPVKVSGVVTYNFMLR